MNSKKVFLTGASGFLGAHIARCLLQNSAINLICLVRKSSNIAVLKELVSDANAWQRTTLHTGDLRDLQSFQETASQCDTIFHVAAEYTFWSRDPKSIWDSNILGTKNILTAARGRKLIYTSTVGTIGIRPDKTPSTEEDIIDTRCLSNPYKKSKFEAEQLALEQASRGEFVVIGNPSAPIGPGDHKPTPTGQIIVDFARGRMPAYLDTGLNFVHVHDVAMGHLLLQERGRSGERYILGGENWHLRELLERLGVLLNRPAPKIKIPYSIAWIAGHLSTAIADHITHRPPKVAIDAVRMAANTMFFSSAKARNELGYSPSSVDHALKDAVNWFKTNHYF